MVNEGNNNYWSIRSDDDAAYNSGRLGEIAHLVLHFFPTPRAFPVPRPATKQGTRLNSRWRSIPL